MSTNSDSLQFVPMEEWGDLGKAFQADWPRGIPGYNALITQRKLEELGLGYGFKVYRPRGPITSGMVALNRKKTFNEVIIQCPSDDTTILEAALMSSKVVDWSGPLVIPYLPADMVPLVQRVVKKHGMKCEVRPLHYIVTLRKSTPLFEDVCLPEGVTFDHLTDEHVELTDSLWLNQYETSKWLLQLFIKNGGGYGLFKDKELVAWVYINEIGSLFNLYTLDGHRKKGYAKMLVKLVCNKRLEENKDTFACCLHVNDSSLKLFESLDFERTQSTHWLLLTPEGTEFNLWRNH